MRFVWCVAFRVGLTYCSPHLVDVICSANRTLWLSKALAPSGQGRRRSLQSSCRRATADKCKDDGKDESDNEQNPRDVSCHTSNTTEPKYSRNQRDYQKS